MSRADKPDKFVRQLLDDYTMVRHTLPGEPEPDPSNFVAWDSLDEFTVLSWMTADMTSTADEGNDPIADIESSVDAQIAEKAAPTSGTGVPW